MLIDWFTVGAQSLNFLILVYLLKRFLYQPILHAIDAREKEIADKLTSAQQLKAEAQQQRQIYEDNNHQFLTHKQKLLHQAIAAATSQQQVLIEEAKAAAALLRQKASSELNKEIQSLQDEIAQLSLQHIYANTEKILQDLAGQDLQQRIFEVFITRLKAQIALPVGEDLKAQHIQLLDILKNAQNPLILRSAEPLSVQQQDIVTQCFAAKTPLMAKDTSPIKFVVAASLICGVELLADGWKLSWSGHDYLASLQASGKALCNSLPEVETEHMSHSQIPTTTEPKQNAE